MYTDDVKRLQTIPGVGKTISKDLVRLGFLSVESIKGQNPEDMYNRHNKIKGATQDKCMLYVFRCAVYFANTLGKKQDQKKLLWWYWKNA